MRTYLTLFLFALMSIQSGAGESQNSSGRFSEDLAELPPVAGLADPLISDEGSKITSRGEFGRTACCQGKLTRENYGRDHHPRCFTMWFAGGGIAAGPTYGATDDFSYNVAENPVHIHDLNVTIL